MYDLWIEWLDNYWLDYQDFFLTYLNDIKKSIIKSMLWIIEMQKNKHKLDFIVILMFDPFHGASDGIYHDGPFMLEIYIHSEGIFNLGLQRFEKNIGFIHISPFKTVDAKLDEECLKAILDKIP